MAPRSKRTVGEYAPMYWDGDGTACAHYVTGHVTDDEFRAAVNDYHGTEVVPLAAKIQHVHVRSVRAQAGADFDYEWRQCAKGRGAMAVTVWNVTDHRGGDA